MTTHPASTSRHDHARSVREQKSDTNMRGWGNTIRLWRVCEHTACTQARACRGDVKSCWRSNFQLLPELVQCWTFCLFDARERGMTFEEAMAALDKTPMPQAYADWLAETGALYPARPEAERHKPG